MIVSIGAQLITMATTVSLKNLTDMKFTNIATLPVSILITSAGSSFMVIVSKVTLLKLQFKQKTRIMMLMSDLYTKSSFAPKSG